MTATESNEAPIISIQNVWKFFGQLTALHDVSFDVQPGERVVIIGPSGSGKSHRIYEEIMQRAAEEPGRNFLIIVPDQFTMQTQKDLVMRSDRDGILNIDVLSFGRLSHRILEEVGTKEMPVLDDTGKSLVLQKVAADLKEQLPAMGSLLHKQGYIHEVKSAISEFMQYGISTQDMDKLITSAQKRGALAMKLKDLKTLYRGFQDYIRDHFITTEETLDVLRRSLSKSKILKGSVVVFDGFTGFTPIQNRLIQELMRVCAETIVTVTIGVGEDPYKMDGEQKLFHLSKKTVADLEKLAAEAEVERGEDLFVKGGPNRFAKAPALHYLEQNLFRYQYEPYAGEQQEIHMFEALSPREEVHQTALYIRHLIREQGMTYRDIAVVIGDLEGYASYVETEFGQLEIPCFLDRTRGIVLNPMIERRYGRIVSIASIAAAVGILDRVDYSAAKGGIVSLTKALAMEVGGYGVTVNSVSPGAIARRPTDSIPGGTYVGRMGTPEEVASLVAFLASEEAAFITGCDYIIDGGRVLGPARSMETTQHN